MNSITTYGKNNRAIRSSSVNVIAKSKLVLVLLSVYLLVACSGQSEISSSSTELSTQTKSQTLKTENTSLLASLAREYPNGQLPADRAAQAALALSQNPSVFKESAAVASQSKASAQNLQTQAFTVADFKPVYRIQNTTLPGSYFFTIYDSEKTTALAANPNWQLEGAAFYTLPAASTDLKPVYRFRNKLNGSYLYTAYESEKTDIETNYSANFELEGVAWRAQQTPAVGYSPLYRFRNLVNGTYLNTAYESEKDAILRDYATIFDLEGPAYYVRQDAPCTAAPFAATGYSLVFKGCSDANQAMYYAKDECVRDNTTGLIWQGQTGPGTGLRANDQYKTNYDSTVDQQIIIFGGTVAPTQAQVDDITNSVGFKNAINAASLCGSNEWRIPTKDELISIINRAEIPTVDNVWFPNILAQSYWTSSPGSSFFYSWVIRFSDGFAVESTRGAYYVWRFGTFVTTNPIRLVR